MSIQHILVTILFPLLFVVVIVYTNDRKDLKSKLINLLTGGEDNIDYYFEILELKFDKDSWILRRLLMSLLIGISISYLFYRNKPYLYLVTIVLVYKYFYFDLYSRYRKKIRTINKELPYFLKMVVNGCYYRPLLGSLITASDFVFDEFKNDVNYLINEIDENPTTYKPYEALINKYNNQIRHLDTYLKSLYRLSMTSNTQASELLETLSKMVSDDINIIRSEKNSIFNSSLSYLGLIPVIILTIAITAVLMLMMTNII